MRTRIHDDFPRIVRDGVARRAQHIEIHGDPLACIRSHIAYP